MDTLQLTQVIAYRIYELRGRSDGNQLEDWVAAERLIQDVTRLWTPAPVTLAAPAPIATPEPAATDPAIAASVRLSRLERSVVVSTPRRASAARELAAPGLERQALEALEQAVARQGRAAVAACLGWSSTGPVAGLLRGDKALDRALAARILAAFAPPARAAS
jgi:hypothetical protein